LSSSLPDSLWLIDRSRSDQLSFTTRNRDVNTSIKQPRGQLLGGTIVKEDI
jgi:hypothetical protein